ncbi:MAG: acyl carrier protein [Defluviitaleaceae bacterium]|nr:acyl carrier protein [Defluviitaleaceae bacterium]
MVFDKIKGIVAEHLGKEEADIKMETSFVDDLGADSLDLFQIISELEEAFDIEFAQEESEKIATVGDAVNYIESLKK